MAQQYRIHLLTQKTQWTWVQTLGQEHPLEEKPTPVFFLENLMDIGAWRATVHTVAKSWTRLKRLSKAGSTMIRFFSHNSYPSETTPSFSSQVLDSVQERRSVVSNSLRPHGAQHTRPRCPSPSPRVYPNSSLLSWWCHPTISSFVVPFSSHLQSFPASQSFPMESVFPIRWPKHWSFRFSIRPSNVTTLGDNNPLSTKRESLIY